MTPDRIQEIKDILEETFGKWDQDSWERWASTVADTIAPELLEEVEILDRILAAVISRLDTLDRRAIDYKTGADSELVHNGYTIEQVVNDIRSIIVGNHA